MSNLKDLKATTEEASTPKKKEKKHKKENRDDFSMCKLIDIAHFDEASKKIFQIT